MGFQTSGLKLLSEKRLPQKASTENISADEIDPEDDSYMVPAVTHEAKNEKVRQFVQDKAT